MDGRDFFVTYGPFTAIEHGLEFSLFLIGRLVAAECEIKETEREKKEGRKKSGGGLAMMT